MLTDAAANNMLKLVRAGLRCCYLGACPTVVHVHPRGSDPAFPYPCTFDTQREAEAEIARLIDEGAVDPSRLTHDPCRVTVLRAGFRLVRRRGTREIWIRVVGHAGWRKFVGCDSAARCSHHMARFRDDPMILEVG